MIQNSIGNVFGVMMGMKNSVTPVLIVTVILVVYALLAELGMAFQLVLITFLCSPFMVIWMVISVLKSKDTTHRTFDEYFYDDVDIKSSGKK